MSSKFDHKALAHSIGQLLATAESNIARGGASIATQRLIDYSSGEFAKLKPRQLDKVLKALDGKFKKRLLKDGFGNTIGYVYSDKIFVSLKDNQQQAGQQPSEGGSQEDYAAKYAGQYLQAQGGGDKKDKGAKKKPGKKPAKH